VFYRTQDHLISDDGEVEPAWGNTKSWPAIVLLSVACVSAALSISIPQYLLQLTISRSSVIYEIRQMGKSFRYSRRKFNGRRIRRLPPHMGNFGWNLP
jgi:hypothetical protein